MLSFFVISNSFRLILRFMIEKASTKIIKSPLNRDTTTTHLVTCLQVHCDRTVRVGIPEVEAVLGDLYQPGIRYIPYYTNNYVSE